MILIPKKLPIWRVLIVFLTLYFSAYAVFGSRGVLAMAFLKSDLDYKQEQLVEIQEKTQKLSHRVTLMRPDSLDLDMLDEQARRIMNYTHPDDIVHQ